MLGFLWRDYHLYRYLALEHYACDVHSLDAKMPLFNQNKGIFLNGISGQMLDYVISSPKRILSLSNSGALKRAPYLASKLLARIKAFSKPY